MVSHFLVELQNVSKFQIKSLTSTLPVQFFFFLKDNISYRSESMYNDTRLLHLEFKRLNQKCRCCAPSEDITDLRATLPIARVSVTIAENLS